MQRVFRGSDFRNDGGKKKRETYPDDRNKHLQKTRGMNKGKGRRKGLMKTRVH